MYEVEDDLFRPGCHRRAPAYSDILGAARRHLTLGATPQEGRYRMPATPPRRGRHPNPERFADSVQSL